jgi:hypothetical protein
MSSSVELVVPLRKQRTRVCCELCTRVKPISESLVEFMERHRDEITKRVPFELDQSSLGYLMLDMQTMKSSMLGQASITQESSNQNLLLPTC